jgi:hypothetical protein
MQEPTEEAEASIPTESVRANDAQNLDDDDDNGGGKPRARETVLVPSDAVRSVERRLQPTSGDELLTVTCCVCA